MKKHRRNLPGSVKYRNLYRSYRKTLRRLARTLQSEGSYVRRKSHCLRKKLRRLGALLNPLGLRVRRLALGAVASALLAPAGLAAQPPAITAVVPTANATAASSSATIGITFSTTMNVSTLTAANIRIYGSQTGFLSTRGTFSGNQLRNFNPDANFKAGERISVSVTGATSTGGSPMAAPLVYSFRAEAGGSGSFAQRAFGLQTGLSLDVAVGDLDGDGDLDAIVVNANYFGNELWLNNGDGTFSSSTFGGGDSYAIALGDLDSDGDLDAIKTNYLDHHHEIWLNNGDATFSSSTIGDGIGTDVALGDLDGDGDLDAVICTDDGSAGHQILINNGDGSFSSSTFASSDADGVALGDLDGDGDLDIVIGGENEADILALNNGDATFVSSTLGINNDTERLDIGDLDGDGDLDVFFAVEDDPHEIWLNNGDATFSVSTFGTDFDSEDIELGDLDGDGDLDAIIANDGDPHEIWFNNGDATFSTQTFDISDGNGIALGDLDGDGDLDAIIANYYGISHIWFNTPTINIAGISPATHANAVPPDTDITISFSTTMNATTIGPDNIRVFGSQSGLLSSTALYSGNPVRTINPAGPFKAGEEISVSITDVESPEGHPQAQNYVHTFRAAAGSASGLFGIRAAGGGNLSGDVAAGDLDGDGDLDLIFANYEIYPNEIWLNNGDATFAITSGPTGDYTKVALGDLDGDGDLDAVFGNYYGTYHSLWLNNGDASFSTSSFGNGNPSISVDIGDLDGDGDLDVITGSYGEVEEGSEIWLNNGDATFSSYGFGPPEVTGVAMGDIDNDGDLDVLAVIDGMIDIWTNSGGGLHGAFLIPDMGFQDVQMGDLNNDGYLDAVGVGGPGTAIVLLGNGDGSFADSTFAIPSAFSLKIGDLDGDGDLDLAMQHPPYGTSVWHNNGDATFTPTFYNATIGLQLAMGDLDGDGDLDMASANIYYNNTIFFNSGAPHINSITPATVCPQAGSLPVTLLGEELHTDSLRVEVYNTLGMLISTSTVANVSVSGTQANITLTSGTVATAGTVVITAETGAGSTHASILIVNQFALIDHASITAPQSVTLAVLSNDLGNGLQLLAVSDPPHGVSSTNGTLVTYTPDAEFSGIDSFGYIARNAEGCTSAGVIVVAVAPEIEYNANLQYAEHHTDGSGGVNGLHYTIDVQQSPDGKHVYALGQYDNSIAIFSRNSSSGTLSYTGRVRNGAGGVNGMNLPQALAISPDGANLYVAGYGDNAIVVFSRDTISGALTFLERKKQGHTEGGGITIDGIKGVTQLAISPDGLNLYAAGYGGNTLAVFSRNPVDGTLGWLQQHKDGQDGVDGLKRAHGVTVSPDGKSVYVAAYADDAVTVFNRDLSTGALTYVHRRKDGSGGVDGLNGAKAVAVSPDAQYVYVAGYNDRAVAVFSRNPDSGVLSFVHRLKDGSGGVDGLYGAQDVEVSDDGSHVYTAGYLDNALAIFSRNRNTGVLSFAEILKDGNGGVDGLQHVKALDAGADSRYIYCAAYSEHKVSAFFRNRAPLALNDSESIPPSSTETFAVLLNDSDPDGHSISISSKTDGSIGTVLITGRGTTVDYTSAAAGSSDSFTYTIEDGFGGSATATVSVSYSMVKDNQPGDDFFTPGDSTNGCAICKLSISPNPLKDAARIQLRIAEEAYANLRILDPLGRVHSNVYSGSLASGEHSFRWDAGATGSFSGVYLCVLEIRNADGKSERRSIPIIVQR